VTIRETVGWEMARRSPRNSCVAFCGKYMQAISTALCSACAARTPLGTAKVRRYGRVDAVEIVEITCLWCARSPPTPTGRCTRSGT
jgi:hypothetical protein